MLEAIIFANKVIGVRAYCQVLLMCYLSLIRLGVFPRLGQTRYLMLKYGKGSARYIAGD